MVLKPTRVMPCRNIARRWTGSARVSTIAGFSRRSWPRDRNISRRRLKRRSSPISLPWTARSTRTYQPQSETLPRRRVRFIKRPWGTGLLGPGIRTFHALHLAGCRTDPRAAAAGGLDRRADPGRAVADPADAALPQPTGRPRDGGRVRQGIPGRDLARTAAGLLVGRHRLSRRRQPHVRRLSA